MWPRKEKSSCLYSWRLSEDKCAKVSRNESFVYLKNATKTWSLQDIGVGSLWDNEKCELATNNGDTLGEAVISAKGTNLD